MQRTAVMNGTANAANKFDPYEDVHLRQLDETICEMSYDDDETRDYQVR